MCKNRKCWICQSSTANSGEHIIKKTDLKNLYSDTSQNNPIYKRQDGINTRPIGSINSDSFKYEKVICSNCNNHITQTHDKTWQVLSKFLLINWQDVKDNNGFYLNKVFSSSHKENMTFVQLFFIKLLGCKIAESGKNFYLKSFALAINNNKEHPNVYISFRDSEKHFSEGYSANSNFEVHENEDNKILYIHWFYTIGPFSIDIICSESVDMIDLNGAKKPSEMGDFVSLSKLNYNQNYQA